MREKIRTVAVLGGAITRDARSGIWRTTRFNEGGDNFGAQGDQLRVVAAAIQYKKNPDRTIVIVLGGKGQLRHVKGVEPLSAVLTRELVDLGVPKDKIIRESRSGTTYSQLVELQKIIRKMKLKDVQIISNRWHLPRIKATIDYGPKLEDFHKQASVRCVSAEAVVVRSGAGGWKRRVERAYASRQIRERIKVEREGVRQIKCGEYKYSGRYC